MIIRRICVEISSFDFRFGETVLRQTMKRKRKSTQSSAGEACRGEESSNSGAGEDEKNGQDSVDFGTAEKSLSQPKSNTRPNTSKRSKRQDTSNEANSPGNVALNPFHFFTEESDVRQFRQDLLQWYDANKRDLPWRKWASHPNPDQRAYGVWVSEIMLQQTQVATVIDYYNRWMEKWPTLEDLALLATPEEVNEMWAGLGYYSRGRRLHEGAKKVLEELAGKMPKNAESLMKQLPGVGRYTAGAIASIAFKEPTGVVDGNVIRVFCRARAIGSDSTSQTAQSALWSLANALVDPERPGDFNQALMELGATVCTPKAPSCDKCPIRNLCRAVQHEERIQKVKKEGLEAQVAGKGATTSYSLPDIECAADACQLCIPAGSEWDIDQGVMNFPRKPRKKPPRQEKTAVCIVQKKCQDGVTSEYLLVQRPEKGLLAGLWEFPSVTMTDDLSVTQQAQSIDDYVSEGLGMRLAKKHDRKTIGEVVHIFSHIEQTYCVETFHVNEDEVRERIAEASQQYRWLTAEDFSAAAVSTAMKKCFSAYQKSLNPPKVTNKKIKFDSNGVGDGKKQSALDAFFKPVKKKK